MTEVAENLPPTVTYGTNIRMHAALVAGTKFEDTSLLLN
jgi:hypothetical protein